MAKDTGDLLREALSLPPEARAALADSLLESLDTDFDEGAEQEWLEEIRRRIADLDSGRVQTVAWSEVHARLNRQIGR